MIKEPPDFHSKIEWSSRDLNNGVLMIGNDPARVGGEKGKLIDKKECHMKNLKVSRVRSIMFAFSEFGGKGDR
jgi:hypothetical protein